MDAVDQISETLRDIPLAVEALAERDLFWYRMWIQVKEQTTTKKQKLTRLSIYGHSLNCTRVDGI